MSIDHSSNGFTTMIINHHQDGLWCRVGSKAAARAAAAELPARRQRLATPRRRGQEEVKHRKDVALLEISGSLGIKKQGNPKTQLGTFLPLHMQNDPRMGI